MPAFLSLILVALLGLMSPTAAIAQGTTENAEARVYFEEGNRLFQEASRARGAQRTTLLQRSLEAYVDSLQIVRSRNALFNAAIVLSELERYDESFNYFTEYLRIEGLSDTDRADAARRRDELRAKVAVLEVITEPVGALVWVDRKDLAPRGETPIELALTPGEHRVFVKRDGYASIERDQRIVRGETVIVDLQLSQLAPVEPAKPLAEEPIGKPRLRNAAIGTAAATVATGAVALGLSLKGRSLRDDYDQAAAEYRMSGDPADYQRAQDLADRTDRFNLAADVLWGTTIALGVSAIVLYGVHRKRQKREAPNVAVSVSRHGGFASLTMPFGAGR
ncbi:MAG: PEGA domain-containing protein [Myxococcales bacterium]|nr:MAG: PEGA domain-containing protein [Myxococcales bacterium]